MNAFTQPNPFPLQGLIQQNQSQLGQSQMLANQSAQQWQHLAGQFNQLAAQRQHRFMIDGRSMTFNDFLDEVAPDTDSPMRTFLTLKYQR